jgi:rhodanese-related sulfurtransferase
MAHISVEELHQLLQKENTPVIVDVRSPLAQQGGRIPGALTVPDHDIEAFVRGGRTDGDVIVYCSCPNEASAARVAKLLMQRGYHCVRPLAGGIDAWMAAGYEVELA